MASLALLFCGCGGADATTVNDDASPSTEDSEGCLECVSSEPAGYTAEPPDDVRAFPTELMFYGDLSSHGNLAPQTVTVANYTPSTILISTVEIHDDGSPGADSGGAAYFQVDDPPIRHALAHGEKVSFDVRFMRSSAQRDATLIIGTSHPSYSTLTVELSGKYFLW